MYTYIIVNFRHSLTKNVYSQRSVNFNHYKNTLYRTGKSQSPSNKTNFTFPKVTTISLTLTGGAIVQLALNKKDVFCDKKKTRLATYRHGTDKSVSFNWAKFWSYLKPHLWYFIAAIAVSFKLGSQK